MWATLLPVSINVALIPLFLLSGLFCLCYAFVVWGNEASTTPFIYSLIGFALYLIGVLLIGLTVL